jgi:hypothetical protein
MTNDKLGLSIFTLSAAAFAAILFTGAPSLDGHVALAFLCLCMFGMFAGAQLLERS